uniref:PHD-type domain-containing protein n=1 Tax=Heliothis virescens TaxID=7102 RepID=A0A2A4JG69_HELVI
MNCSACHENIDNVEESLRCTRDSCGKLYHPICTGKKSLLAVDIDSWICPECYCAVKRGGDNSFTPVGPKQDPNITHRKKATTNTTMSTDYLVENDATAPDMYALCSEISVLKELLNKALLLISSHEEKLSKYTFQVEQLNKRLEKYEKDGVQLNDISQMQHNHASPSPSPSPSSVPETAKQSDQQSDQRVAKKQQRKRQDKRVVNDQTFHVNTQLDIPKVDQVATDKQTPNNSEVVIVSQQPISCAGNDSGDGEWTVVKKRNSRQRPSPLCGAADPGRINLKAKEIRKYLHLWNMASCVDEVRQYITHLCPTANCSIDELTARGDYKSYKIGVAAAFYDNVRGLKTKLPTWRNNLALLEHNLAAVTETFLDSSIADSELETGDWNVLRRDRNTPCGGVLLAARTPLVLHRRREYETDSGEDLWASFTCHGRSYLYGGMLDVVLVRDGSHEVCVSSADSIVQPDAYHPPLEIEWPAPHPQFLAF